MLPFRAALFANALAAHTPIYAEGLSTVTDAVGTWTEVVGLDVAASRLEPDSTYAVFWSGDFRISTNTSRVGCRLTKDGASVVAGNREPKGSGDWMPMGGIYLYSTASTPVDVSFAIEIQSAAGGTASGRNGRLTFLLLGSNDENTTTTTRATMASSTFANKCTLTFTPPSQGDYIYVASMILDGTDLARNQIRLSDAAGNSSTFTIECDNSSSRIPVMFIWRRNSVSAVEQNVRIQQASLLGASYTCGISEMRLLALRVDDFPNLYSASQGSNSDGTQTSYTAVTSNTFTPDNEWHLSFAAWALGNSAADSTKSRFYDDGVTADDFNPMDTGGALTIHHPGFATRCARYGAASRTQTIDRASNSGTTTRLCAGSAIVCLDLAGRY